MTKTTDGTHQGDKTDVPNTKLDPDPASKRSKARARRAAGEGRFKKAGKRRGNSSR